MTDHDFQAAVTGTLARLETKMDIVVGADGTGGWKANVEDRLGILEAEHQQQRGRIGWISNMVTAGIASGLTAVAQWIFHR